MFIPLPLFLCLRLLAYYFRNGCFPSGSTLPAESSSAAKIGPAAVAAVKKEASVAPLQTPDWLPGISLFTSLSSVALAAAYKYSM
jgi:hypothetical protein